MTEEAYDHPLTEMWKERQRHRSARLPRWGGRHGDRVKGSVRWDGTAYLVTYSHLLGYQTTMHARERFDRWSVAMNQYREHDRNVREFQKLNALDVSKVAIQTFS